MDERKRQIAENEARFRAVNEGIEYARSRLPSFSFEIVCECGRDDCTERIQLTAEAYEHVRASGRRFALKPGHEITDLERVVERYDEYIVVEKAPGEPAEIAESHDPRR